MKCKREKVLSDFSLLNNCKWMYHAFQTLIIIIINMSHVSSSTEYHSLIPSSDFVEISL